MTFKVTTRLCSNLQLYTTNVLYNCKIREETGNDVVANSSVQTDVRIDGICRMFVHQGLIFLIKE